MDVDIKAFSVIKVVLEHHDGISYLDSDEVICQSKEAFDSIGGVDEVVLVANPFIHLQGSRSKARGMGLKVRKRRIGWIGFDKKSVQWQTRGPIGAFVYTVGRAFFGRFGQK